MGFQASGCKCEASARHESRAKGGAHVDRSPRSPRALLRSPEKRAIITRAHLARDPICVHDLLILKARFSCIHHCVCFYKQSRKILYFQNLLRFRRTFHTDAKLWTINAQNNGAKMLFSFKCVH